MHLRKSLQRSDSKKLDTETSYSKMKSCNETVKEVKGGLKKFYEEILTIENWRKTVLLACVVALGIDPSFFFVPVIDSRRFCVTFDMNLGVGITVLRTFIDIFYVIHIIYYYKTELVVHRSGETLHEELIICLNAISKRKHLIFYFVVDVISVLPIPQVAVLTLSKCSDSLVSKAILKWIILTQCIPRVIRIYPLLIKVTKASGTIVETKWIEAAFNLFVYLLVSYVFGAFWYVNAVERRNRCWREACARTFRCNLKKQFCTRSGGGDNTVYLNTSCPLIDPDEITNSTIFNFGMYIDALKSGIVDENPSDFPRKFIYCYWWGLRNLSALGQNLKINNSAGDICFAITICATGLILFAVLIGNVQKVLLTRIRVDEMQERKRDTNQWMLNRNMPQDLKERIRKYQLYEWRETRGILEKTLLNNLPDDLRLETKRHLCLDLFKKVPLPQSFKDNTRLLQSLYDRVKPVFYQEGSYIIKEGDPVGEMLIVTKGKLRSTSSSNEGACHPVISYLEAGDVCRDLLDWLRDPLYFSLPLKSNRKILALTDVEGFIILHYDLKSVLSHFNNIESPLPSVTLNETYEIEE